MWINQKGFNAMNIEELDLTARTYGSLKRAGIDTVEQLRKLDDGRLLKIRSFGQKSLEEVRQKVTYEAKAKSAIADITYCSNGSCPFEDCERHLRQLQADAYSNSYVSIANFSGTCRDYIGHLAEEGTSDV